MKTTQQLIQWTHAHPLKAIGLAVLLTMVATFTAMRDDLLIYGVAAFAVLTLLTGLIVARDTRKLALAVALALIVAPAFGEDREPVEAAGGCVVVVVVVGGVIVYSLVKFCQKHFPPPPPVTNAVASASSSAGSLNSSSCGSCDTPSFQRAVSTGASPVTFEIVGRVEGDDSGGVPVIESFGLSAQTNTVDWAGFAEAVRGHGIEVLEHGQGEAFYGLNGQPTTAENVPISFGADRSVTVSDGGLLGTVVVERSEDLQQWATVLTTHVSQGYRFRFVDVSLAGQAFYRVTTK